MWPRFKSWHWCHMWVEFVLGSLLCSERFFSRYSGFSSPKTPTFPNSHSTRNQVDEEPLCGRATSKSLFIYYLFFIYLDIWEEYCGSPVFQCIIVALLNYTKLNYTKSHHYRYTCMLPFERKHTFNTARDFQRNYVNLGLTDRWIIVNCSWKRQSARRVGV